MNKLEGTYNPKEFEQELYREWEEKGYFRPSMDKTKEPYCIMMPPPNVTGKLHMGHALDATIQDTLIRTKRMQGYDCLWLPGTDHASISTEMKVVQKLKEEGKFNPLDKKNTIETIISNQSGNIIELDDVGIDDSKFALKKEEEKILKVLNPKDYIITLEIE